MYATRTGHTAHTAHTANTTVASERRGNGRLAKLVVAVLVAGTLATAVGGSVDAGLYAGGGDYGPYFANSVIKCQHQINGQFQSVAMVVPPPVVYAKDVRAGANNDSAWIRYRAYLVNYKTGRTVEVSNWSGWALAGDATPARYSGATLFNGEVNNGEMYTVDYRIEWWDQTRMTGWVADRATNFHYYDYAKVGPIGMSTCWRFR